MRRIAEQLSEADIISLQHAGRLVMRRPRLFDGVVYKTGDPIPTVVPPRRILQFHSLGHVEILPESVIVAPAPGVPGKPNQIADVLNRAFQPTANAGKRK